ncbi:amidase, partial [Acinetobacter baumannii]
MAAIADLAAVDLAAAIRRREISPVEAVGAALSRIERGATLNAFMAVCADRALAEARQAEARIMRAEATGPLE